MHRLLPSQQQVSNFGQRFRSYVREMCLQTHRLKLLIRYYF